MSPDITAIVVLLVIGFAIWQSVVLKTRRDTHRHQETMTMIEKGVYQPPPVLEPVSPKERYLLVGIILSALGLAFLVYCIFFLKVPQAYIAAFVFLFPGLGLIGYYPFLAKKEQRERKLREAQERARFSEMPAQNSNSL